MLLHAMTCTGTHLNMTVNYILITQADSLKMHRLCVLQLCEGQ